MDTNNNQKEQIAEVFQKHFNHHGFKKTSVDDIAKELKISKKTIYQYFSTKEKIFYYIIKKIALKFSKQMWKKVTSLSSATEKIEKLTQMIFEETRKYLKQGNDAFEFKYKYEIAEIAFKEAYNDLYKKIIQEGISKTEFTNASVDLMVRFINGIISESMKLISANPDIKIEDETIDSILRLLKKE